MVWRYACAFNRILKLFLYLFSHFNLDIFQASIQWQCICSRYVVTATPPTVKYGSFLNFTGVLIIVWKVHVLHEVNLVFTVHFFLNFDYFHAIILWKWVCSLYFVSATPPTVLGQSFWKHYRCFTFGLRICVCSLKNLEILPFHYENTPI